MPEAVAPDFRKLKSALVMASEIMGLILEALRQEFAAGRWAAFEATQGFLEGPAPGWVARAAAMVRSAPEDDVDELANRLRGSFLDMERACRAAMRLLHEEKRCRRDEVCAGEGLAPTQAHESNLSDLREIMNSLAPALCEPGLRQLVELAEAPEPAEGSRAAQPAVRLAGLLLLDADRRGASDILAVPGSWVSLVQYRMGGALVPILELPLWYHRALVERFKSMAGLDLRSHRSPQEARAAAEGHRSIVRILPTVHGERLDIHLEGPPRHVLAPKELGLTKNDLARYEKLSGSRHGLILHAGLAGTGKRTAILAGLAAAAQEGRGASAMLRHNPYDAAGVSVSLAASGAPEQLALLRAMLQRKPDVLGIDDLSSPEVLREALQAAAGGVLVLGSLRCDGALAALRHILEEGMDAALLRESLLAVCGHRLPRRLCSCHKLTPAKPEEAAALGVTEGAGELRLGRPVGCPACLHTGFRGLAPVFELLTVGKNIAPLLKPGVTDQDWLKAAQADGMTPLREGLCALAREGITSLAEAARWGLRL